MISEATRRYLVAYDIPDDKRRSQVARCLQEYGDRIQFSVFVCDLKPARLLVLKRAISERIERDADSILVCNLGPVGNLTEDTFSFIGLERSATPLDAIIL